MEYKVCTSELKQSDDTNFILDHFISTETQDDGGDVLLADGMITRGKVVVLFQHGYDMQKGHEPIAKPLSIVVGINAAGAKGIIARTQFFPDEQGKRLYQKSKDGYAPNWSVGWNPLQVEPIVGGGRRVTKWQLMEYSLVAVGMNPEAVTEATKALEGIGLQFKACENCTGCGHCADKFKEIETPPATEPATEDKGCGGGGSGGGDRIRKRPHKALVALHGLIVSDLKAAAEDESFVEDGATKTAQDVLEDFGDNVPPHVLKYIKAVSEMAGNDTFGDEGKELPLLEEKGHQAHHNSLSKVFGEMVTSIRSFKSNKEVDAEKEADKVVKNHGKAALPHAVEFIKAYAKKLSEDKKALQHKEPDPAAPEPVATLELKQPDVVLTVENPAPPAEPMVSLPCSPEELKQMMTRAFDGVTEAAVQKSIRKLQGKLD